MTYGEISDTIASKNRVRVLEMKERASFDHIMADLIGTSVGRLLDKNAKYPSLYDAYPTLFKEEIEKEVVEEPLPDWMKIKAQLTIYATAHNKKRGESDNSRGTSNIDQG